MRAVRDLWVTDAAGNPVNLAGLLDGLSAKEPFQGAANTAHTFTEPMRGLVISNDHTEDLTVTLLGMSFLVKAGEVFEEVFEPFTDVQVTATGAFRAYGRN